MSAGQELQMLEQELDGLRRELQSLQTVREPVVNANPPVASTNPFEICGECLEVGGIFNCPECDDAPVEYFFSAGTVECHPAAGGLRILTASDVCQWQSVAEGATWTLDAAGPVKTLTLDIDDSISRPRYVTENWCCLCAQTMTLNCDPHDCAGLKSRLCVTPVLKCPVCDDPQPAAFEVTFDDIGPRGDCDCSGYTTHTVPFLQQTSAECIYRVAMQTPDCTFPWGSRIKVRLTQNGVIVELIQMIASFEGPGFKWSSQGFDCFGVNAMSNPTAIASSVPDPQFTWNCAVPTNITVTAA